MQDNAKTNASEEARQRRNARERAKRASETEAYKEERLRKRREKDRARRRLGTSEKNTHWTSLATIVLNGAHPSYLCTQL